MPLPHWLRPKDPASLALAPGPAIHPPLTDHTPDPGVRVHMAAHDPAFPQKREAALAMICARIDALATDFAHIRTGTTWARQSARGKTALHLQRSRYGFDATLTLRFLPAPDIDLTGTLWDADDDITLDQFDTARPGTICYIDVHDDPATLDRILQILQSRALPWLDAHHDGLPALGDFAER